MFTDKSLTAKLEVKRCNVPAVRRILEDIADKSFTYFEQFQMPIQVRLAFLPWHSSLHKMGHKRLDVVNYLVKEEGFSTPLNKMGAKHLLHPSHCTPDNFMQISFNLMEEK